MKKKTIATSLLAILVSTYATPFVSNAEAISGETKDTTEQVAPTAETEAPTAETEAPTAETEAPTAETEASSDAKETPDTKFGQSDIDEAQQIVNLHNELKTLIDSLLNDGIIDGARHTHLEGRLNSATTLADLNKLKSDINYYIVAPDNATKLPGIKQEALNQLNEWVEYGQIDSETYANGQAAVIGATTAEEVAQAIADVEAIIQANTAATLTNIKENAKDQLLGWFNEGLLTPNDYAHYLDQINAATDAEGVAAIVASAEDQAQQNGLHTSLDTIKQNAKDQLFTWLSYGQINDNQYVNGINAINNATTPEEVAAVIAGLQAEIDNAVATTLDAIKEEAKDQLLEWFNQGLLTPEWYGFYLHQVIQATDAEKVASIIANAELTTNAPGVVNQLEVAKNNALDQLLAWFNQGLLTAEQYSYYVNAVTASDNVSTISDLLLAAEQQIVENGLHATDLDLAKVDAKDQLATWLNGGWITEYQYFAYLSLVDNATTPEEVASLIQQLLNEIDNADTLENAQNNATDQLITWLAEGKITEAQYYTYLQRVADATTVAEVNAILDELRAIIDGTVEDVTNKPEATPSNPEDVTNKPEATPSEDNKAENTLISKPADTKQEVKKETIVTKVSKNEDNKKAELPKTGEVNQNLTALGLVSVALGSLVAVFKRKRS